MLSGIATKEKADMKEVSGKVITGAEALILSLLEEEVNTIFGYPGGAIMPVYDILYNYQDKINHILVRHEQGAAHSAQAYSMVTGNVGVCLATSGPGATNLITGIANANLDSVPMVFITAQVPSAFLGTDAFQETDMIGLSMPVTKWNVQITDPDDIPEAVAKAFYIAVSGRPGPVLLDITKDAQIKNTGFRYLRSPEIRSYNPYPRLDPEKIEEAADLINKAKKPMILAGHGVLISKSVKELKELTEKTGIPVACTLLGLSCFDTGHHLYTGMLGMHGNYGPNIKTNECDLLIAVGMRFDDRVTGDTTRYAKQAKIIHIEVDKSEINKNVNVDVAIHADAKSALTALIPKVKKNSFKKWLQEFRDCDNTEYEKVIKEECSPCEGKIKMGEVVSKISEKTDGKAIVVADVGQQQMITARYYKHKMPNHFLTSGGLGTMGFGLPAAIGARIGAPDEEVILFVGDGGIQMTIQEMGTIFQYDLNVKIVVLNNNFLGMVRQWQAMFFNKRYSATNMVTPDFITIAKGYGIKGKKVSERKDLNASLDEMLKYKKSFLLEVMVEREANIYPMISPGASVSEIALE